MRNKWDQTACFLCDYWWIILLLIVIPIGGVLGTRNIWMPEFFPTETPMPTPTVIPTATATAIPTGFNIPSDANETTLCPGAEAYFDWQINIPNASQYSDFLFAFDQTGSMGGVIEEAQAAATQLMEMIISSVGDARFGVAGFSDEPADTNDSAYRLYQPITDDFSKVQSVLNNLEKNVGGDTENYMRVMYEGYSDTSIGWRTGGRHIIIFFGDDYPEEPDSSVDGIYGTSDDLRMDETIRNMVLNNVILVFVFSSDSVDESLMEF